MKNLTKIVSILVVVIAVSSVVGVYTLNNLSRRPNLPLLSVSDVDNITGYQWKFSCGNNYTNSDLVNGSLIKHDGVSFYSTSVSSPAGFKLFSVEALAEEAISSYSVAISAIGFINDSYAIAFFNHTMNSGSIGPSFHRSEVSNNVTWYYANNTYTFGSNTTYQSFIIGYRGNFFIEVSTLNMVLSNGIMVKLLTNETNIIFAD